MCDRDVELHMNRLTVVIPCYCSAGYLADTVEEVFCEADRHSRKDLRMVLVEDGSPDETADVIRALCVRYEGRILGILLAENAGQTQAKMAGLTFIEGGVTAFMDDDGQHDPAKIFELEAKVLEGYDIVYAQFPKVEESLMRRFGSRVTDLLLTVFTKKPAHLRISSFMAISEAALEELKRYRSRHPFMGGWLCMKGYKPTGISVSHRAREDGTSRYTLKKLVKRMVELTILYRIPPRKNEAPPYRIGTVVGSIDSVQPSE